MKKELIAAGLVLSAGGAAYANDTKETDRELRAGYDAGVRYTDKVEFPQRIPGDAELGRAQFGLAPDLMTIDRSQAIFEGTSVISGPIASNQTVCADCHDGHFKFLMPPRPLSANVAPDSPLRTARDAEAQGDPRQAAILENHGLVKHRPARFDPLRPESDAFRKFFAWRKTPTILNTGVLFGQLTDGHARHGTDVTRGAIFTHTQSGDGRFDDLLTNGVLSNVPAFMERQFDPPELAALIDPNAPDHQRMVDDPFYTVHPTTDLERKGQVVFEKNCMGCHDMPNVFSNRDHVAGAPANFPPLYGHTFDVGVSQANRLHLDFRYYDAATGAYSTTVLPLVRGDGALVDVPVVDDVGAAATTGRYEDLHRFKVPQLRRIKDLGPYFHDNSAATLEDVLDHFNSAAYNESADGRRFPIHVYGDDRRALLAFLRIL